MIFLERRPFNSATAKLVGNEAGSAGNIYEKMWEQKTKEYVENAKTEFLRAIYVWCFKKRNVAAKHIEKSLKYAREAYWRTEYSKQEEECHELLHKIAKWKHDELGCQLQKTTDGGYVNRCSIALTHKRLGFSMGLTGDRICQICFQDEFDCMHSHEKTYWVRGGTDNKGNCFICREKDCKAHGRKYIYRVCPSIKIENPILHEVSMVEKPAFPSARLTELPVSKKDLEDSVGIINESKGMVYLCHACSGECPGFHGFNP